MNATASESKQSTIYSSSILVMWTISPHPAAPMGGFSWKPLKASECISSNFSLAQTLAVKQRHRAVALSRPSIYLTACLSTSSSSQWLFPVAVWPCACPPRGGGTLGPLTYPRSGSRVEWVREGGKKCHNCFMSRVSKFHWGESKQIRKPLYCRSGAQHQKTTSSHIQTGSSL